MHTFLTQCNSGIFSSSFVHRLRDGEAPPYCTFSVVNGRHVRSYHLQRQQQQRRQLHHRRQCDVQQTLIGAVVGGVDGDN